jgi:formylglycine-generating enzyme required for sulfatase activity
MGIIFAVLAHHPWTFRFFASVLGRLARVPAHVLTTIDFARRKTVSSFTAPVLFALASTGCSGDVDARSNRTGTVRASESAPGASEASFEAMEASELRIQGSGSSGGQMLMETSLPVTGDPASLDPVASRWPTPDGMVPVPPGSFTMGSDASPGAPYWASLFEMPAQRVTLTYAYWIGRHEVTQAEYEARMNENPAFHRGAERPVERVTWFEAAAYCRARTEAEGAAGRVPPGYEYRLPTEAEWEHACRAGTTTEFNVGSSLDCSDARFRRSLHSNTICSAADGTADVGSYPPNAWGLFDMHGNVWEWCLDSYAPYSDGPAVDRFVTGGAGRIVRGGSWNYDSNYCRSAFRYSPDPSGEESDIGFRVVLAPSREP